MTKNFTFFYEKVLQVSKFLCTFAPAYRAQMAEWVDALVSNTNAARRAGSIPALGTGRKELL